MIIGIGTDIVAIDRFVKASQRFGSRLAKRLLTRTEYQHYRESPKPAHYLGRRFAAKEAAVKALGTGFRQGVRWQDIEVLHDPLGKPSLALHGKARELSQCKGITHSHLSLSDERKFAIAYVIMEQNTDEHTSSD